VSRAKLTVTEREIRRRRNTMWLKTLIAFMVLLLIGAAALLVYERYFKVYENPWAPKTDPVTGLAAEEQTEAATESEQSDAEEEAVEAQSNRLAAQYDYDGAIELLKAQPDFSRNERWKSLAYTYEQTKAGCVSYPVEQITHIFFHTLIADDAKAFDGDEDAGGYNQVMTTISEFESIINQMYNRGYVMVSMHDMVEFDEEGNLVTKEIYLPQGKTPFVLSQDDCSYYHYMDDDGFAANLTVDEEGKVRNTMILDDGSVVLGDYDVVPIIDRFVEQHPDFAYHGHKGIIALTGYEGVLGYRTDEVYKTQDESRLTRYQKDFLEENPNFSFEEDVAKATQVAEAMKAEGWEFASHTWGHIDPMEHTLEEVQTDSERWDTWVKPIVGETDVLIFAFGADISDWEPYSVGQ